MRKRKTAVAAILTLAMTGTMLGGCQKETEEKENGQTAETQEKTKAENDGEGYTGELSLMHFSTAEESAESGSASDFRTVISNWEAENPDITLTQNVLSNDDYKTQIATQAAAGDLPDVFLIQGMNTKTWAEQGLILDMSEIVKSSPYYDTYNSAYFTPYTVEDKVYGLPALTGSSCSVVVYDKAAWKDAGFDEFPATWEEVKKADKYFKENGYTDTIAFGNGGQWQINSCFLSVIGNRFTGDEWFKSIIDKNGAKFTDDTFVSALDFTKDIFDSGVFNEDFNAIGNEDAREYYIAGTAPAFIGGNWDVTYLHSALQEEDEELFANTGFAVLPQPEGAKGSENTQDMGLGYAVALNAKLKDDPEKMKAAADLACYLTGAEYADMVAKSSALQGLSVVENVDLDGFDSYTQDFYNYQYVDTEVCDIYDSYVNGAVWDVLNTGVQSMLNGDKKPEDVAAETQEAYEKNY